MHRRCHCVGICHVQVIIAIIAHEAQRVLPSASMGVGTIVINLVDHNLCLIGSTSRQASYGSIDALTRHIPLVIIKQTEIVVSDIAIELTVRVLALIAQQEVLWRQASPVAG